MPWLSYAMVGSPTPTTSMTYQCFMHYSEISTWCWFQWWMRTGSLVLIWFKFQTQCWTRLDSTWPNALLWIWPHTFHTHHLNIKPNALNLFIFLLFKQYTACMHASHSQTLIHTAPTPYTVHWTTEHCYFIYFYFFLFYVNVYFYEIA